MRSTIKFAALGACALAAFWQSPAQAGSDYSLDAWAADYQALAVPAGTVIVIDYLGTQHSDVYVQNANNLLGKIGALKGIPALTQHSISSDVTSYSDITRVTYFTSLWGHPVVLDGAFDAAAFSDTKVGIPQTSKSGFGDTVLWATYGLIVEPKNERYLGITDILYIPTGVYNKTAGLNPFTADQYTDVLQVGWTEGLSKFGLHKFWFDFIGNVSFHSDGTAPFAIAGVGQFDKLKQDNSYDVKAFARYEFGPAMWVAAGIEKSWGGNQTASGGFLGDHVFGSTSLGTDEYLRGHIQASMPLARDIHVALDLKHDFEVNGGLRENFGAELRVAKFFFAPAPLEFA